MGWCGGQDCAGTPTDAVRSLVGFMVRTGAVEPDIGTVAAFKKALREAKSISYSKGPSGLYVAELLERLGLAQEMKDKTVFAIGRPVGAVVASGEAEVGMQQIIENQPVEGAHLVGPLPSELHQFRALYGGSCSRRRAKPFGARLCRVSGIFPGGADHLRQGHGASVNRLTMGAMKAVACRTLVAATAENASCACAIALSCPYRLDFAR